MNFSAEEGEPGSTIDELARRLKANGGAGAAREVEALLTAIDAAHREGLTALVEMIRAWRGEIFLDAVERQTSIRKLLRAYDLP